MTTRARRALGVYVHIPFCVAKCRYCDFASHPLAAGDLDPYLTALECEILGADEAGGRVATIFFGGGTPSLLSGRQLARLLGAVRSTFLVDPGAEITVEANPGTLDAAQAEQFRALGVNRVSLGVQALDDALLARVGRCHTGGDAVAAFGLLRAAGFDNIGVDLIHGLPGQTPGLWRRDLERVIALGPQHLSLYALTVEEGTPLAADLHAKRLTLPTEDDALAMLEIGRESCARAGYERYEISNWSLPGRRCRHNLDCWALVEYRGFGAAAHSFLRRPGPLRLANAADTGDYMRRIASRGDAVASREEPSPRQLAGEALMLGLRTTDGVDVTAFTAAHGAPPAELFPEALSLGVATSWTVRSGGRLRLTDEGLLFSNQIFRLLF